MTDADRDGHVRASPTTDPERARAERAAQEFVMAEAGFAQVISRDHHDHVVGRSVTAFLRSDWSVDLVQRRQHARLVQWRRDPNALVMWVGTPAAGATNEHPHVFDIGVLPPRAVFVRGSVTFLDTALTERIYRREIDRQRASGLTRAPLRGPEDVERDLVGVRVIPVRVRLEGFGQGAQAFDFAVSRDSDGFRGCDNLGGSA